MKIAVILALTALTQVHGQEMEVEIQRHIAARMVLLKSIQGDYQTLSSEILKEAQENIGKVFSDSQGVQYVPLNLKGVMALGLRSYNYQLSSAIDKQMDSWKTLKKLRESLNNPGPIQEEQLKAERVAAKKHQDAMHEVKLKRRKTLAARILILQRGFARPVGKPEDVKLPPVEEVGYIIDITDQDMKTIKHEPGSL